MARTKHTTRTPSAPKARAVVPAESIKQIQDKYGVNEKPVETRASRSKKPAPKKTRLSKSVEDPAIVSDSEEHKDSNVVVFKKDSFVAYIDRSTVTEGKQQTSIGKIVEDTVAEDKLITVVRFDADAKQKQAINFTLVPTEDKEPYQIKDFQVICSVDISKETAKKVILTKKASMEITKLLDNIFDSVKEKLNDESDEEAEKQSEDKDSEASEKEGPALSKRTFVKGKRQLNQTQVNKSAPTKIPKKKVAKKESSDSEQHEDEADEEFVEAVAIKNQIGKKRPFPANLESMSQPTNRKVKKLTDSGASQNVEVPASKPVKKVVKPPSVFKVGKWNPDTVLIKPEEEQEKSSHKDTLLNNCCTRCNSRNLVRAIATNNLRLLKTCLNAKDTIPSCTAQWSVDAPKLNPIEMILSQGSLEMLKAYYNAVPCKSTDNHQQFSEAMLQHFMHGRVRIREPLLTRVDTGSVSYKAYGTAVRAVQQTRGNRQGNQAFILAATNVITNPFSQFNEEHMIKYHTEDLWKVYQLVTRSMVDPINYFYQSAISGNIPMVKFILEKNQKHENFGFNKLHLDVITLDKLTEKYHTASITKKAANSSITPLHLACLNPSRLVLAALLDQNNDVNVQDTHQNKPIHYAAICESSGPLKLLLEKGSSVFDLNGQKKSPLHFAAINSRAHNVRVILESNLLSWKYRDRQNKTAFTYACENGDIETIKAFLEYSQGKVKINTGQGIDRMTPLMYAAATGNYELAEFLLERKARVLSKDKFKRTPLIIAVRNGHTRLASLLLQNGSDWKHIDSSNNTPLHYAAGSGFIECIDLLIKHGADLNAMNSWKVTPITIAMLNNHLGTVKRFLQEENVDVNGKDDKGRTLLSMAMLNLEENNCVEFVKYLLDKGADPNLGDVDQRTPLHILAAYKFVPNGVQTPAQIAQAKKELQKTLSEMIDLLLTRGGDLTAKTDNGMTPFEVSLECDNIDVLQKFAALVKLNQCPQILHKFKTKIFDERFREILVQLLKQETDLATETMNCLDFDGFSPFLQYIHQYTTSLGTFSKMIEDCLIWNSLKHKLAFNKYTVTNALLYNPPQQEQQQQMTIAQDTHKLTPQQIDQQTEKYLYELFTVPFIELMRTVIGRGANASQKVDKTKFYRELDEHKRHLMTVSEGREAIDAVQHTMQIDTVQKKGEVKTRTQVLAEQRIEKKPQKGGKDRIPKLFKEFYAKKQHQANFMKKNGKMVEVEYSKVFGMQNAIHLIFKNPKSEALYEFLADELKIAVDEIDFMGRNPFMINVTEFPTRQAFFKPMESLLQKKVRFDLADQGGKTAFLVYYEHQNKALANRLLDQGANIRQMDQQGLFALKYALIRRQDDEIKRLVAGGADINQIDNKGRNLLHHAVNMSSATADATFETEQTLIDLGISINLRDSKGRVPLHYAFVKLKSWSLSTQIDPIETVSSLCGQTGLEIEVSDKWNKTPLHYAAQRGSAICTLYILQRGANIESLDIYNNSALGICLLRKHFNYAILLIQKSANVCLPIYDEYPNRLAKQWKDQAKKVKRQARLDQGGDVDMESNSDDSSDDKKVDTGKDLFKQKPTGLGGYGSEDDDEDDEEESEDESEESDAHEQQVFNQQNAFGMSIYNQRVPAQKQPYFGGFGGFGAYPAAMKVTQQQEEQTEVEKVKPPISAFRLAIQNQQQGLAYLILDNKYDYMLAMQDALDEKKFNLVLTLLSKTSDNTIVQRKNDNQQNLMHILAKNSSGGLMHILRRIYDQLRKRGVDCLEQDSLGNNALHYSVTSRCYDLCSILLSEGISVNAVNNEGHSPLSLYMKGSGGALINLTPLDQLAVGYQPHLFTLLASKGADMNFQYPEEAWSEKDYKCSIMINIVRHNLFEIKEMRGNLQILMSFGATLDLIDSRGQDVIMHSIMQNSEDLVKFFINNKVGDFFKNHKDLEGKNAIHYVVNPHNYGSFENTAILDILAKANLGFDLNIKDKFGMTPLDYANRQKSGAMSTSLMQKLGGSQLNSKKKSVIHQNNDKNYLLASQWPARKHDFDQDSHDLVAEAEAKRVQELMEEKKDTHIPLDVGFAGEKQYKVYFEGEGADRRPYDAYMTKVDLKNGWYGDYTFYKMQMVYDSNRDLFIVLTRYGRIGEEGINQRTPFNTAEDAKKEFCTIFKQKSANDWETAHTNFDRQKKKYVLINITYSNVKHQDYLAPFDFENCAKTQMEKTLRHLIEEISNVTMYQRSLQDMGIDQSLMPASSLKKETIEKAKIVLGQLSKAVLGLTNLQQTQFSQGHYQIGQNYEAVQKFSDEMCDLTSEFYQLIPMKETKYWEAAPIRNIQGVSQLQQKLDTLTNIEFSSRLLLGALYRQISVNPIDYVYESLETQFRLMNAGDPEYDLIHQFILNTSENKMDKVKINLFKIQRKGEGERYENFQHLKNRRLLFHGSAMTNMLGILAQGLRIAPVEAPVTGYMFGKGLYFADLFNKSANYSHGGSSTRTMLLCEVALGNMLELYKQSFIEQMPHSYDSVKAVGKFGANYQHKNIVTPEGFEVPMGKTVKTADPTSAEFMKSIKHDPSPLAKNTMWSHYNYGNKFAWPLQATEYIVYKTEQVKARYVIQWEQL